ncbi:hypothetical protein GOV09_05725 [Candidatus Woesearchaeota archaeon]|nr:hypothetical protein [Candidatus Woesearchaeota archaeon]
MKPSSVTSYVFSVLSATYSAPEFALSEFNKYKEECLLKSRLSEHGFQLRFMEISEQIEFARLSEYKSFLKKALAIISDPKDSPYLALALAKNSIIWSNDKDMKAQSLVRVLSTKEIVQSLLRSL